MTDQVVSVVLADPQPVVCRGLRALLSRSAGVEVVAEAQTAREAIHIAAQHRPDVLVIDALLSGMALGTTIREVRRCAPGTAVLVFTIVDDEESVVTAVRAGARGYLFKNGPDEGIVCAVRGLAAGETVLGPGVVERLLNRLDGPAQLFPDLTARERQVLDLVVSGMRNTAIALQLRLSPKTIANLVSTIFGKLGVADRAEAAELVQRVRTGTAGVPAPADPYSRRWPGAELLGA